MKAPVFLLAIILCVFAANGFAATLVVTKTADTNDGVCDADCSLREAVGAAAADDIVAFSALFNSPQWITLTLGQIVVNRNLTISGPGQDHLSVSGNNKTRIFNVDGVGFALAEMMLRDGRVTTLDAFGGAIYATGSTLYLTNVAMSNNYCRYESINPPMVLGFGGAIYSRNGSLTVTDSTIEQNTAPDGGGIYCESATINISNSNITSNSGHGITGGFNTLTVINTTIDDNSKTGLGNAGGSVTSIANSIISNNRAGGISSGDANSQLTIDHCLITGNLNISLPNRDPGGVNNSGTTYIRYSSITNNRATGKGGGIHNGGTMYIENSSVLNNRAQLAGGGAFNVSGQLYVTNSTFSGNTSMQVGGGIHNYVDQVNPGARLYLTNATVAYNTATGNGGGVRLEPDGTAIIRNTILANNTSVANEPDVSGNVISEGFNLVGSTIGSTGWLASDLLNINPLLAPLGNNGGPTMTHAILPGSPATNAGNNDLPRDPYTNELLVSDQRGAGFARIVNNFTDIGAYEANYAAGPVTVGGRVLVSINGRGVSKAYITLTDPVGHVAYTQTNPFGYYRFFNLLPGTTYTIRISHKSYTFDSPQYITVDQNREDLNFMAL